MGTIIEACASSTPGDGSPPPSAIELADAAGRVCLERAERGADDVQLLINAGVYLDENISEPAIAALIQEDIGANPEIEPGVGQGTFSFDVRNGPCGLLTGIYLIDGLLASGTIELGMVVAGDADPEPGISTGFGFPPAGGAVLLGTDVSRAGFTAFTFRTFPQYEHDFQSYIAWREDPDNGHGRNSLTIEIDEHYRAHALQCAEATVRQLGAEQELDLADVDLLIATAAVPDFAGALASELGLAAARVVSPMDGLATAHTAAAAIALESAPLAASRTALIVSAGAGISVVAALYQA